MGKKVDEVFRVERNMEPLADKTIPEHHRLITHLLIVTGCRRGEIMGLKRGKVDFENSRVKIDRALVSSKSKGVYEESTKTSDIRHSLPHINPHAFRHTVVSVLLANRTDIVTVSKQLGHASITTTESFYTHIIEEN